MENSNPKMPSKNFDLLNQVLQRPPGSINKQDLLESGASDADADFILGFNNNFKKSEQLLYNLQSEAYKPVIESQNSIPLLQIEEGKKKYN